ncbi:hypothetical protein P8452_61731 [Trifolium repens]|nr:hypothetical protein P8452_61731 [Trifolium repens]
MSSVSIAGENFVKDMASLEKSKAMISNLTMVPFVLLISLGETFVVEAKVWIDNGQIASLIYVKDCNTGTSIEDYQKINRLEGRLRSVLQGDSDVRSATTSLSDVVIHPERRLHQMMYADRDYQKNQMFEFTSETPLVTLQNWAERGYSIVNVQCKDRSKLLFDVVFNLTDMEYVVFHATIHTRIDQAYLEFYKRHKDGTPISSEPERQRLIQCLQAAVERRSCKDRSKLLFDVVFNLTDMEYVVFHATIHTRIDQAYLEFYKRHKDGTPISSEPERQRLIQCLQAAVERRSCKGVRLELSTEDRQGLLAEGKRERYITTKLWQRDHMDQRKKLGFCASYLQCQYTITDPSTQRLNNFPIILLFDQVQHSEDFTLDLRKQQSKSSFSETYTRF